MSNKLILFIGFVLLIVFSACKKESEVNISNSDEAKLATVINIQTNLGKYMSDKLPFKAIRFRSCVT